MESRGESITPCPHPRRRAWYPGLEGTRRLRRDDDSGERALADRLINYSDAVVALAVVGVSGLGIAVADPDIRTSVAIAADWVAIGNLLFGALATSIVLLLRSWSSDLWSDLPPSPKVTRYSRKLHVARLVVIWVSVSQTVVLMLLVR